MPSPNRSFAETFNFFAPAGPIAPTPSTAGLTLASAGVQNDTVVISDGTISRAFELTNTGKPSSSFIDYGVKIGASATATAVNLRTAIAASGLAVVVGGTVAAVTLTTASNHGANVPVVTTGTSFSGVTGFVGGVDSGTERLVSYKFRRIPSAPVQLIVVNQGLINNLTIKLQDSSDDITYTDVAITWVPAFTTTAIVRPGGQVSATALLRQYVKIRATGQTEAELVLRGDAPGDVTSRI